MNAEVLFQNIVNLFIIALILEASVMALFSISLFKKMSRNIAVESARDVLILVIAALLCYTGYKHGMLSIFHKSGFKVQKYIDIAISTLVLVRFTKLIMGFFSRMRENQ
jgi:hypothetical protein